MAHILSRRGPSGVYRLLAELDLLVPADTTIHCTIYDDRSPNEQGDQWECLPMSTKVIDGPTWQQHLDELTHEARQLFVGCTLGPSYWNIPAVRNVCALSAWQLGSTYRWHWLLDDDIRLLPTPQFNVVDILPLLDACRDLSTDERPVVLGASLVGRKDHSGIEHLKEQGRRGKIELHDGPSVRVITRFMGSGVTDASDSIGVAISGGCMVLNRNAIQAAIPPTSIYNEDWAWIGCIARHGGYIRGSVGTALHDGGAWADLTEPTMTRQLRGEIVYRSFMATSPESSANQLVQIVEQVQEACRTEHLDACSMVSNRALHLSDGSHAYASQVTQSILRSLQSIPSCAEVLVALLDYRERVLSWQGYTHFNLSTSARQAAKHL